MTATIYHNPSCGTSRNTLALMRQAGLDPCIIEYVKTPPSRKTLRDLLTRAGLSVRDGLRERGTPFDELGLADPRLDDEALLDAMMAHPILINRPLVVTERGVALCRPSDLVLDLVPPLPPTSLSKEDGEPVLRDEPVVGTEAGLRAALAEAGLPTDDLEDQGRHFFAYQTLDDVRVGYGGFELLGTDALLRSVVVPSDRRGRGVGRSLVLLLLRRAFDLGARKACLLTTSAAPFFERLGFAAVERAEVPAAVLATRQASSLCPSTATVMARRITL